MKLAAVALLLISGGCASLGPGMRMDEQGPRERARRNAPRDTPRDQVGVIRITGDVVAKQAAEWSATLAAPRRGDPLAQQAGKYEYRIAPHDVLSVIVWGHPELTIPAGEFRAAEAAGNPVNADGTVFYPFAGIVEVAGKTLPEVREILTTRLRRFIENPQLDVRIAAFRGQTVHVAGEVVQPSTVPVTDVPLRVQDAIAAARGFTPNADPANVTLTRDGVTHRIDLEAVHRRGDVSQNWLLKGGDILHVGDRTLQRVFVLGEVRRPSAKPMLRGHLSLADAIADAEGPDPLTSNTSEIYVIRGSFDVPQVFRLDASSADALLLAVGFQLRPNDVVYVGTYGLTTWNRIATQLLPSLQIIYEGVYIQDNLLDRP